MNLVEDEIYEGLKRDGSFFVDRDTSQSLFYCAQALRIRIQRQVADAVHTITNCVKDDETYEIFI